MEERIELEQKLTELVSNNKDWSPELLPFFSGFLEYLNGMSQVFVDVDMNMLRDLIEFKEQREIVKDFLTNPNKKNIILVRSNLSFYLN